MNFYTYLNNCVENAYIVFEATDQSAADTKASGLGVIVGTDHRQFTKTESDTAAPTIEATMLASQVDGDWISTGSGKHGQVVFDNGNVVSF